MYFFNLNGKKWAYSTTDWRRYCSRKSEGSVSDFFARQYTLSASLMWPTWKVQKRQRQLLRV
jgi:hypothetical protein